MAQGHSSVPRPGEDSAARRCSSSRELKVVGLLSEAYLAALDGDLVAVREVVVMVMGALGQSGPRPLT